MKLSKTNSLQVGTTNTVSREYGSTSEAIDAALQGRVWSKCADASIGSQQASSSPGIELSRELQLETHRQIGYSWAAGFLDGEGSIGLAKVKRTCGNRINYRVRVNVVQNCRETLQTFCDYVSENHVLTQIPHRESYTRPIYQVIYDGVHAYRLLKKLRPYLVRKGKEADVIFEYYANGQPTRHFGPQGVPQEIWHIRGRCYDALRCLK